MTFTKNINKNRRATIWMSCCAVFIIAVGNLSVLGGSGVAQERLTEAQREQLSTPTSAMSGELLVQLRAVGDRLARPGKEATVIEGQLLGLGSPKTVQILHQLSGMVKIEGVTEGNALSFDGETVRGLSGPIDQALLETFVMDSVEGMIYAARIGSHVRLMGRHFGPDPRVAPDYRGPRYDIYEVITPARFRRDRSLVMKRYYFDSSTGLLLSTRYSDSSYSPPLEIETRFSNWDHANGSAYPGRIEHFENGNLIFSLAVSAASSQTRQDVTKFR